ncbi:MAG: hypothetical protein JHD28_09925, partial [Bacteroidia bacterium]|nr:hypothetical protein [Bacteroidia bacterium]
DLNNANALLVKDEKDLLDANIAKIMEIYAVTQKSELTPEIEALDARRDKAINGIIITINGLTYHFDSAKSNAANLLAEALKPYGSGIATLNYALETAQIDGIVKDFITKLDLKTAANLLGLTDWITELNTANAEFNNLYIARTQQLGAANPDNIKVLRQEANQKYYDLRDMLDGYYITKKKIDPWKKTINELNALIDQYNTLLANRKPSTEVDKPEEKK